MNGPCRARRRSRDARYASMKGRAMTDDPPPFEFPDVRVLTITLSPPTWVPVIDYGDDLDDLAALGLLKLATRIQEENLVEACLESDDEDDD